MNFALASLSSCCSKFPRFSFNSKDLRAASKAFDLVGDNLGAAQKFWMPDKSWAVIDRPYSSGSATVGALYERPGKCQVIFAQPLRPERD
jgi:hypothetical protein